MWNLRHTMYMRIRNQPSILPPRCKTILVKRGTNGKILKGSRLNPTGANGGRKPVSDLYEALEVARKRHNKTFLQSFVDRAYFDTQIAIALAKKLIPDRIEGETIGDRFTFISSSEQVDPERMRAVVTMLRKRVS